MKLIKEACIVGFALFSMYFGAGNIIFPPFLGVISGESWATGFIFYFLADIGLALIAIFAMIRTETTSDTIGIMRPLGNIPGTILLSAVIICVGPLLAVPRTATVAYEIAIQPIFPSVSLTIGAIAYFTMIYFLTIKESSLVDIIGKILTPILAIGLFILIIKGLITPISTATSAPMVDDIIWRSVDAGYQTLDVCVSLTCGLIIINALKSYGHITRESLQKSIIIMSVIAGTMLFLVYGGLYYLGATVANQYSTIEIDRGKLIIDITQQLLGEKGSILLGIIVFFACITTATALIGGTATFFSKLTNNKLKYNFLVIAGCVFSTIIALFGLEAIISISTPILTVVYPPAIVVIVTAFIGGVNFKNKNIYRYGAATAFIISIAELLNSFDIALFSFVKKMPLHYYGFSWAIPAIILALIGSKVKDTSNNVKSEISME